MVRHIALLFCLPVFLFGATLRVTVRDPQGARVPGADIAVLNAARAPASTGAADASGVFAAQGLGTGTYFVTVAKQGFAPAERTIAIADKDVELVIDLQVAAVETMLDVATNRSALANSDPNYRALRDSAVQSTVAVKDLKIERDQGTFLLREGRVSFLAPVLGRTVIAVFTGSGTFSLSPLIEPELNYLKMLTGKDKVEEDFESVVFLFTDKTAGQIKAAGTDAADDGRASAALKRFRSRVRHRATTSRSMVEAFLQGDDIANLDATILAELYNPGRGASFRAYIKGKKHDDLRFFVAPRGALPELGPEEVALFNMDTTGTQDGIWYLTHLATEWQKRVASSDEIKHTVKPEHYRIETAIGNNNHLAAVADVAVKPVIGGERVIPFGLLPNLRVNRVTMAGKEIPFVQEGRKDDGSFYVVAPEALATDRSYTFRIEYEGNKVIEDWGDGNYAVGARTSWYPTLNSFQQQASYDLVFKVPKRNTLVSVGKLVREGKEDNYAVTEWKCDTPIAVAGFNYGEFKRKRVTDEATHYDVEAYATTEMPGGLRNAGISLTPSAMAENALITAQNSMRIFSNWFGDAPYGRIAITQQPQFNFGQSWPTLVYLPISAFLDDTQRWHLLGGNAFRFAHFIQEVTPHEVAHQWWGHMVGWASYHDQWLSEGFADFSAAVYLLSTEKKPDKYRQFWERNRKAVLEKNEYGRAPNDAGPLWMGLRLNTAKTEGAYNRLVYPKGGYVLWMLRNMMWDPKTGDQDFKEMMKDFVKSNLHQNASTASFMAAVQRHMKPSMNGEGNGTINWFFRQWVFGTEVPRYDFEYSLKSAESGQWLLTGKVTQSNVSDSFFMPVPIYADFDGNIIRLGLVPVKGSASNPGLKVMLPKKPKRVWINANDDILASESNSKEL